jgi:hypothetical protein
LRLYLTLWKRGFTSLAIRPNLRFGNRAITAAKLEVKLSNSCKIAEINDRIRHSLIGCKVILTKGVACSPDLKKIIQAVQSFKEFNEDNDPYKEHDFGSFKLNETKYFFKFDYYDDEYDGYQENGNRVLTIGRMDDY